MYTTRTESKPTACPACGIGRGLAGRYGAGELKQQPSTRLPFLQSVKHILHHNMGGDEKEPQGWASTGAHTALEKAPPARTVASVPRQLVLAEQHPVSTSLTGGVLVSCGSLVYPRRLHLL